VSKAFSKSTNINKPGISSSSNLSKKSEMILTIYLSLKKPFLNLTYNIW
jgi:hypothetical protein